MGRGLFITGTDTAVGKTLVAAGLAALLKEGGIDVGVMKPAESGCPRQGGKLVPQDALFLRAAAGVPDSLELVNPYRLEHPLAPAVAAQLEGVEIKLEIICSAYEELASRHELMLVEGAGGLMVPLSADCLMADLAQALELSLLIVARASLGTLNHTLLTLHYARQAGLEVIGVLLNHTSPQAGLAEATNAAALQRWGEAPFLGTIPYIPSPDAAAMSAAISTYLRPDFLEGLLSGSQNLPGVRR